MWVTADRRKKQNKTPQTEEEKKIKIKKNCQFSFALDDGIPKWR